MARAWWETESVRANGPRFDTRRGWRLIGFWAVDDPK